MKLENIDSNKILASCRYANGSKGDELFVLYHSYDFEQFDKCYCLWRLICLMIGMTACLTMIT